ncbi:MAG: delta-60 repeat domain-containing protein [Ahniella sp.]|nr:delta-60 repeat domain-containing protein [Ahniella sp.]
MAVRADGKPIVAGSRYSTNAEGKILVCRFNVAGNLDSTF